MTGEETFFFFETWLSMVGNELSISSLGADHYTMQVTRNGNTRTSYIVLETELSILYTR